MAAIADADISINAAGDIRWTGAATTNRHTILEFIQWLMLKQDDEQAAGDDLLDITVDTPFDRKTDQIVILNSPFNIDDTFSLHLYDGSVSQTEPVVLGETLYSGLEVLGPVESGTEYMIIQDGNVLPAFWGTGINPKAAPSLVFSRHLIKSKKAGVQIDGQRITVLARELGDQYRRFPVTLGTGNSVAAIGNGADIFNTTSDATLAGYTVTNTEGFQELDIDGTGASGQEFYSQWIKRSGGVLNDTYEYAKFTTQRAHDADVTSGAATGTDRIIDNATIVGQCQSFIPLTLTEKLTEARFQIKIGGGTPVGTCYCELFDSDDVGGGAARPTGSALARSEPVLVSAFTTSYEDTIFRFNRRNPVTGADQLSGLTLSNAEYFIIVRNAEATSANFLHVDGSAAGVSVDGTQNTAEENPAATFTANVADLKLTVKSSLAIHDVPGEIFQGINVEVGFDGEIGAGIVENDIIMWGTKLTYDALVSGPFRPGEYIKIFVQATAVIRAGAKILYDDGVDEIIVALDTFSTVLDDDTFTTVRGASETTATVNVTIVDFDKSGGEAILLAKDDNGATGEVYLNVISGVNPVNNNIMRTDDVTADPLLDSAVATVTINTRTLVPEYIGTSTGSNIIGAYGIGFVPGDVGSSDRFTDLANNPRIPPNNVIFTVAGVVASEDRVLVGPRTGTALDRGMWLLATALVGAAETTVIVKTGNDTVPFPAGEINWPATGLAAGPAKLRIQLDNGIYKHVDYDSHDSNDRFTITGSTGPMRDFSTNGAAVNNNVFLAFIDVSADAITETFTGVHTGGSDRDLFVRVRDGGGTPIKTFESTSAQFLSTPQTIAAIRTSDS